MVTIKDVAKEAKVSIATVSLVLNNSESNLPISEATKERVKTVAEALGYRPNIYAKSLRTQKSYIVGILTFDIVDPFCAYVLRGAEELFNKNGYYPMISDLQNDEQKLHQYVHLFKDRKVDGLLLLANSLHVDDQLIYDLQKEEIPLIVIGREVSGIVVPTVVTDNVGGSFQATEHLISLGHRRIAFILGPSGYVDSRQRWEGSLMALKKHGIEVDPDLTVEGKISSWGPEAGYLSMKKLLLQHKPFTAVVAFDDITAFGAIRAIGEANLKIPEDISVVGFDDIPAAAFYNPALTTIQYSMMDMGRVGAKMLVRHLSGKSLDKMNNRIVAESTLVVRNSTSVPGSSRMN